MARSSAEKSRPSAPMFLGGILTIAAGCLAVWNGLTGTTNGIVFAIEEGLSRYAICGAVILVFGVVAILAGILAVTNRHRSLTLPILGAVLGMLGGGYYGFFLGLSALIMFWLSQGDL